MKASDDKKEIKVPSLGDSMSSAKIVNFLKKEGDHVNVSDPICEIETDKVLMEINSHCSGKIDKILFPKNSEVKQGDIIALIGNIDSKEVQNLNHNDKKRSELKSNKSNSPIELMADKIIDKKKVNVDKVLNTKDDKNKKNDKKISISRVRKMIAENLKKSQQTNATLTTFVEIDISNLLQFRENQKHYFHEKYGIKLGVTSFFTKATLIALSRAKMLNCYMDKDEIIVRDYFDINLAMQSKQGLLTPLIKDLNPDDKINTIESKIAEVKFRVDNDQIKPDDLKYGTFTISNAGVFGAFLGTPIINLNQGGIVGFYKAQDKPWLYEDEIQVRKIMCVALSYDHRIVDGMDSGLFLSSIKEYIESINDKSLDDL